MATLKSDKPRGILNPTAAQRNFEHTQYVPSPDIAYFVEHYWTVRWDLRGQEPRVAETLPHPSIHLTIEQNLSGIVGVMKGKFSRTLENHGRVFGVKFRPGAFHAFTKEPVSKLTDRTVPLHEVFGEEGNLLAKEILQLDENGERIERAEAFLRQRLPERDEMIETINRIVACIIADSEITKVEDVSTRFDLNTRTLQRIFSRYVGVSPKWVIRRYRLHEAVEQLAAGTIPDWPRIALDLGYFDQAHFIKDFKTLVGVTPAEYSRSLRSIAM